MNLDLIYRGFLSSCNYECNYCPFAKQSDDAETRIKDKLALNKFINWVDSRKHQDRLKIMFMPWGEALVRGIYRQALTHLSHQEHVDRVVIQTNMASSTTWLKQANLEKLALWISFHPSEISVEKFLLKIKQLDQLGVRYSVGIVGTQENKTYAEQLRSALNKNVYLWVNAYKGEDNYYLPEDIAFYQQIDPWFKLNLKTYNCLNQPCLAGVNRAFITGHGDVYPCNFVKQKMGNLYQTDISDLLSPAFSCPNQSCDCYMGHIHFATETMDPIFGQNRLERIPIFYP